MAELKRNVLCLKRNEDGSTKQIYLSQQTANNSRFMKKYNISIIDPEFKPREPKITSRPTVESIDDMPDMNAEPAFATQEKPQRKQRTPKA